jgi:hypothetical protein
MGATDRYQLLVESQTRGEQSINRFNDTLAKLASVVEATNNRTARSTETAHKRVTDTFKRTETQAQTFGVNIRNFLVSPLSSASDALLSGASGMGKFGVAAAGVAVGLAAGAIGFKNFVQAASESAREIQSLSQATGLSINQADKLRAASVLAGFDIRNLKEAALDLSQALRDTSGEGQRVRDLLQKLGVAAYTTDGATRNLNDVLLETFDALSKIEDVSDRVNKSRVLGGEDAAKSVQPLLTQYRKLNEEAVKLGFGTHEALVQSMIDANAEIRKFDLQWERLKASMAQGLTVPLKFINENFGSVVGAGKASVALLVPGFGPLAFLPLGGEEKPKTDPLAGFKPSTSPVVASDLAAGRRLAADFRAGQAGTETGLKARLQKLGEERGVIQQKLSSGNLGQTAFQRLRGDLDRLEAEQFEIETRLKLIDLRQAGATITIDSRIGAEVPRSTRVPSLLGNTARLGGVTSSVFQSSTVDIAAANAIPGFDPNATTGALQFQQDQRSRERSLRFVSQELAHQERKVELLTGPGGELAAINAIADLRHAALQQELDLGAEIFDLNERRLQIEEDRTLRILDLERRKRDEARGLASDLIGSLQTGNLRGFVRNQGGQLINQIGTNALTGPINSLLTNLGGVGAASGFGGLLKGTIFDPQNKAIDRNTLATEANTAALTGRSITGAVPGFTGLSRDASGAISVFGSDTNGITGRGPITGIRGSISGGLGVIPSGGLFRGLFGGDYSVPTGDGRADTASNLKATTTAGRIANVAGSAAIVGFAALNATKAFKRGGASGNLEGIGSVLGAAALLPTPAAPFLQAGALIAGFVAAALPDPKLKRDKEIDRLINSSIYTEPTSTAFDFDTGGRSYDYGRGGNIRPIQVVVNTMDAKSFSDNRDMIADAVRVAMYEGHSVNRAAREVVLAN